MPDMRLLMAWVLAQSADTLPLKHRDRLIVNLAIETEIAANDGRDSRHATELKLEYAVDDIGGGRVKLDGQVLAIKAAGTVRAKEFSYEWKRGGGDAKSTGQTHECFAALEKPFKMKLSDRGVIDSSGLDDYLDLFPVFSPSVLVGLPCPLGSGATWKVEPKRYPWYTGYSVDFGASRTGDSVSAKLNYTAPETEVPIEGTVGVTGSGDATAEFKSGLPVKGSFSASVTVSQGGAKRAVKQKIEWTVK